MICSNRHYLRKGSARNCYARHCTGAGVANAKRTWAVFSTLDVGVLDYAMQFQLKQKQPNLK
jgi:hypothetical protein